MRPALVPLVAVLVLSVSLPARPARAAAQDPPPPPADEYLDACRPYVEAKVDEDAGEMGVPGGVAEIELDPLPTRQRKGDRTEVAGGGRFRLGPHYDWQPMTWTCRFDERKGEVDRAAYRGDRRAAAAALPADRRTALDRCRRAVSTLVAEQASRQRWRSSQFTVSPGAAAAFSSVEGRPQVQAEGAVALQVAYATSVAMRYTCTFDPDVDGAIDAIVTLAPSAYTRDGQLVENRYETLICSSSDYGERRCTPSRPIAGNVRVKTQHSKTPCAGRFRWETWAIIVRDGCRAEFEFEVR